MYIMNHLTKDVMVYKDLLGGGSDSDTVSFAMHTCAYLTKVCLLLLFFESCPSPWRLVRVSHGCLIGDKSVY